MGYENVETIEKWSNFGNVLFYSNTGRLQPGIEGRNYY